LIELGADVKKQTTTNRSTPLHIAIKQGHLDVVGYLLTLEEGNDTLKMYDADGRLPQYYAQMNGNERILEEYFNNSLSKKLQSIMTNMSSDEQLEKQCSNIIVNYGQSLGCFEYQDVINIDLNKGSNLLVHALINGNNYLVDSIKNLCSLDKVDDYGITPEFWLRLFDKHTNNNDYKENPVILKMIERVNKISTKSAWLSSSWLICWI